jgi:hypothetical protein
MIKKEYMSPELEMIDIELENAVLTLSTDNGDYDSEDIIDI